MAIQVGTVDGLVNISQSPIRCFVDGINEFNKIGIKFAKSHSVSFGSAFQRFVEPVYKKTAAKFSVSDILNPALTSTGNEQSPARITYCRKMGLLEIDEPNSVFKLTPLGDAILNNDITVEEYAFIILTKMGVFRDDIFIDNLFCVIAEYFRINSTISDTDFKDFVEAKYNDSDFQKTRFDIIVGALATAGIISKVNKNVYALSSTLDAKIFEDCLSNKKLLDNAYLDSHPDYTSFVGSLYDGVLGILTPSNISLYTHRFKNFSKFVSVQKVHEKEEEFFDLSSSQYNHYLTAIRTKPFVLLAGISGTGKSRIVRKLAQATLTEELHKEYCPSYSGDFNVDRWTLHSPENFELIQVKPNWHNSMDVVGFKSNIGKEAHYEFTPFVEFIAKAWHHIDVPFFLCLDEMNLAPVEEYFAEFLSAIESRSINEDGMYQTDPIIKPFDDFGVDVCVQMTQKLAKDNVQLESQFRKIGLTLPPNLIVMGTVNMDETTFSFSRKVLDRAMSIEMNDVNYDDFLLGKTEKEIPALIGANRLLVNRPIKSQEVTAKIDAKSIIAYLKSVNDILEGTPFKLGYRAANEALLYVNAANRFGCNDWKIAMDDFTLMKILSRIEGDDTKLKTTFNDPDCGDDLLYHLKKLFTSNFSGLDECKSLNKLTQMINILERDHFVSFWG